MGGRMPKAGFKSLQESVLFSLKGGHVVPPDSEQANNVMVQILDLNPSLRGIAPERETPQSK